tara:strand:- start:109 stop:1272 length:1164 start_codon:yes stop_codon:yes gene_type:complete
MDVTDQILQQGNLVYSASDNTNPAQISSAKTLNYSKGGSLQKADKLDISVIPYKINYKDEVGLFGTENYYLEVDCHITGDIVLQCFSEAGWNCAFIEGVTPTTNTTVTYYPPTSTIPGTGQKQIDINEYRIDDAQGNAVSPTNTIAAGDTITVNLNQLTYTGAFQPTTPPNYQFQWTYRGTIADGYPVGAGNTNIAGATSQSFTVPTTGSGLVGYHLTCIVRYDYVNSGGVVTYGESTVQNNGDYAFVASGAVPSGSDYENAVVDEDLSSDEFVGNTQTWFGSETLQDTLPNLGEDAYISVELIRKDTGNKFIDSHVDYRLYTSSGEEHPYDKMYIKSTDKFYIGVHARNTKRLAYEFECRVGNEYRAFSSIADSSEIMFTNERPSY